MSKDDDVKKDGGAEKDGSAKKEDAAKKDESVKKEDIENKDDGAEKDDNAGDGSEKDDDTEKDGGAEKDDNAGDDTEKDGDAEKDDDTEKDGDAEKDGDVKKGNKDDKKVERKKIFLVDDTEFILVRTKQVLKDYYTVFTLDSAPSMFDLLEKVKPDMIILDINMPGVDGYETIKMLKKDERYEEIPVIFLSGKDDEDSIIKGLSLGAVDHVPKPYSPKDLLDRISFHLHPIEYDYELKVDTDKNVSKPAILAVDDSPSMLRSIHFALHNKYKVHTLQKPENLEKVIKGLKPELIILDYNMPVINGFALLKIIRGFKEFNTTPVIFLTSESSPENIKEAINLGCSDFMVKPFNPRKLRDKITKCLMKKDG
ncbi:MAG: response regulator [Leptospirales bacterium]|nr:response regulator [Leptospirales bacterium]